MLSATTKRCINDRSYRVRFCSMAGHAHAYLPPIEPRAQRPLWVLAAVAAVIIAGGVIATWPGRWDGDPSRYQALVGAAGLFEEGLTKAALSELDAPLLQHSAEASLLRGVIAIYDPDPEAEEAQRWLEQAAKAGAPGADTLFGFLLLEKACKACAKKAAHWFEHALARRADRYARLGLAEALTQQRYAPHLIRAQAGCACNGGRARYRPAGGAHIARQFE